MSTKPTPYRYGTRTEYDTSTAKRERVTAWSGPFFETFEAEGYANHGAKTYSLITYNGDKVAARLPEGITAPRTPTNYQAIDQAISDALNAHHSAAGRVRMEAAK